MLRRMHASRVFLLSGAVFDFSFGLAWLLWAIYLVTYGGYSPLQLVLVGTVLEVAAFLFEVPTGVVADTFSRKWSVIIGYLLIGGGMLLTATTLNFAIVLLAQAVMGVGFTFTSGAYEAWITDEVGEEKVGDLFLRSGQIGTVAGLFAIALGTALGSIALNLPLYIGSGLTIVYALLLTVLMPETNFKPARREAGQGHIGAMFVTLSNGLGQARRRPLAVLILGVGFLVGAYSEGLDRLGQPHLLNFGFPPLAFDWPPVAWFGIISATAGVVSYFAAGYVRKRVDTANLRSVVGALGWAYLLLVGGLFGFAVAGNFWLAAGCKLLINLSRTITYPLYNTWINQGLDSSSRATVLSISNQLDALGQFSGGPTVGAIGNAGGTRAALTASAIILSPVVPLLLTAVRRTPKRTVADAKAEEQPVEELVAAAR